MNSNQFENTNKFFDKIKSMSLLERIFFWKKIIALSMESYSEFRSIDKEMSSLNAKQQELNSENIKLKKDLEHIKETKDKLQSETDRLKDDIKKNNLEIQAKEKEIGKVKESDDKNKEKIHILQTELEILKSKKDELTEKNTLNEKTITAFEKTAKQKQAEYEHKVTELNSLKKQLDDDRIRLREEREQEIVEEMERLKLTWRNHEEKVEQEIQAICSKYNIDYYDKEKVPFKGKPDNTIKICNEYIIFDAKSPASDDLDNFSNYIKSQAEAAKKYAKEKDVKKDIFLVVPSNTVDTITQFYHNMADYTVFVICIDSLEPIILSLQKIEDYEFAEKLSPEEREGICRVIGKFAHATKRRIQVDQYFAEEFIGIYAKCNGLPKDIVEKAVEFEKSDKLNPPIEKRARLINEQDLKKETKRIKQKAEAEDISMDVDLKKIEDIPLYKPSRKGKGLL